MHFVQHNIKEARRDSNQISIRLIPLTQARNEKEYARNKKPMCFFFFLTRIYF